MIVPNRLADATLRRSPLQPFFRRRAGRDLAVVAYHGIDDAAQFEAHLDLYRSAYHPISLADAIDATAGRISLPPNALLITFDDGIRSVRDTALPMMKARGVPGVAFVVPGVIGTSRPLWWVEVEALLARGAVDPLPGPGTLVQRLKVVPDSQRLEAIEWLRASVDGEPVQSPQLSVDDLAALERGGVVIENHTMSHPCLDRCPTDKIRHEIEAAHRQLAAWMGRSPRAFAYPNGNWDGRAESVLDELGYVLGFLFDHHLQPMPPGARLRISRLRVNSTTSLDRLAIILSGLHPAIHHARGRS